MVSRSLAQFLKLSCLFLTCFTVPKVVTAAWVDPADGWAGQYDASVGLPTAGTPVWTNGGMVASIDATGDGGNPTLLMDMDASNTGGIYYGPGNGSSTDQITIDFRLNTMDTSLASDTMQFHLRVYRPLATGGSQMWTYQFSKDKIKLEGNNDLVAAFDAGWHDWRITIDAATLESNVFMDGSADVLLTHSGRRYSSTTVRNRMEFGRNNSAVLGDAELTRLRWTNSEIAVPEPATLMLLGMAAIGLCGRNCKLR